MIGLSFFARAQEPQVVREIVPMLDLPTVYTVSGSGRYSFQDGNYDAQWQLSATVQERGKALKPMRIALHGEGGVTEVTGESVKSWGIVRVDGVDVAESRWLEITPTANLRKGDRLDVKVQIRGAAQDAMYSLLFPQGRDVTSVSFTAELPTRSIDIIELQNVAPILIEEGGENSSFALLADGVPVMKVSVRGEAGNVTAADLKMTGELDGDNLRLRLQGQLSLAMAGAHIDLLQGRLALTENNSDGSLRYRKVAQSETFGLEFRDAGMQRIDMSFVVPITLRDGWQTAKFSVLQGPMLPIDLRGLPTEMVSNPQRPIQFSDAVGGVRRAYLPIEVESYLQWRDRDSQAGELYYNVDEQTQITVGGGLIGQNHLLRINMLQGQIETLKFDIRGAGEVISVSAVGSTRWSVNSAGDKRELIINFEDPVAEDFAVEIESRAPLGELGREIDPLRFTATDAVRHSGILGIRNEGTLRFNVEDTKGLVQLPPAEFGGFPDTRGRIGQREVYRFPIENYSYGIVASLVRPEVSISEVIIYEMTETDRLIDAEVEVDVLESAISELAVEVPEDYAIAGVDGAEVRDFLLATDSVDGRRTLRILFSQPVMGRQLLKLKLERNIAASVGQFNVPRLIWLGSQDVRSQIALKMAPGYRATAETVEGLRELALSYFPRRSDDVQLAFQSKQAEWQLSARVEALGKNVQADVFHLYTLQPGVVRAAVMLNYYVVGAPVTEWRYTIPSGVEKLAVEGAHVTGWKVNGGTELVVNLQRSIMGASTVLITYEEIVDRESVEISPGQIVPMEVEGERGFVQVVSDGLVSTEVDLSGDSVFELTAAELPREYQTLTSAPSVLLFQYSARPFDVELRFSWLEVEPQGDQLIESAWLESEVASNGKAVTLATYYVKARKARSLALTLPGGAEPWQVEVNEKAANARMDGATTLIPLPRDPDPNAVHRVTIRYAQSYDRGGALESPAVGSAIVAGGWVVKAASDDMGIVHTGGDLAPKVEASVGEDAGGSYTFIWIASLLGLAAVLGKSLRRGEAWGIVPLCALVLAGWISFDDASLYSSGGGKYVDELNYETPAIMAGQTLSLEVEQGELGHAAEAFVGTILLIVVSTLAGAAIWRRSLILAGGAVVMTAVAIVVEPQALRFLMLGLGIFCLAFATICGVRWIARFVSRRRAAAQVAAALALSGVFFASPRADAQSVTAPMDELVQEIRIRDDVLRSEGTLVISGGERVVFLHDSAALVAFESDGVIIEKIGADGEARLEVRLADGVRGPQAATFVYEMRVETLVQGIQLPTGAAILSRASVAIDRPDWDIVSDAALSAQQPTGGDGVSRAEFAFRATSGRQLIVARPRTAAGDPKFYIESVQNFTASAGAVNGYHEMRVRVSQGQLSELTLDVPEGLLASDVHGKMVSSWRFDPIRRQLSVQFTEPLRARTGFAVMTQMGTAQLPMDFTASPITVVGAAGSVGSLGLVFADDAQPAAIEVAGLTEITATDYGVESLSQRGLVMTGFHKAYRFTDEAAASATVKVVAVTPEIRVTNRHVLSIGSERLLLSADLDMQISRVGIFSFEFIIPEGLELQAAGGGAVSHTSEREEAGRRIVTVHFESQMMGQQKVSLTFTGNPVDAGRDWVVPNAEIMGAERVTGTYFIRPEKGLRLQISQRDRVSQIEDASFSDSLAFRTLQQGWSVSLDIERLDPWVTIEALQAAEIRGGQVQESLRGKALIENAAIKSLRIEMPELTEEIANSLRATGVGVAGIVQGEAGEWLLELNNAVAGELEFALEWTRPISTDSEAVGITPVDFPTARKVTLYSAINSAAQIDLKPRDLPRQWQPVDWVGVPSGLKKIGDSEQPDLVYHVVDPDIPLALEMVRHSIARALQIRATDACLTTVLSAEGSSITAMDLQLDVISRGALTLTMPEGAQLFSAFVNGEGVEVARRDGQIAVPVESVDQAYQASIRLIYLLESDSGELVTPSLDVPIENVTWILHAPLGYRVRTETDLELVGGAEGQLYRQDDYLSQLQRLEQIFTQAAQRELAYANSFLQQGDQNQAVDNFRRAANNFALDEDSNEDARVQLEVLRRQQVLLTLNTRQQRLYLERGGPDGQRERIVGLNPYLNGAEFIKGEVVDEMLGTVEQEELRSLQKISQIIAGQQLQTRMATSIIDVNLPKVGQKFVFQKRLQLVDGAPLGLDVSLRPIAAKPMSSLIFRICAVVVVAAIFGLFVWRSGVLRKNAKL